MENHGVKNISFSKDELQTLAAVMDSLSSLFDKDEKFKNIALKLEDAYKKECQDTTLTINMSHFSMEKEIKRYLYLMSRGIDETRLLTFNYINRNMDYTERVVEPIQINFSHGQWYITGFCRTRKAYRRFKLVRIKELRLSDSFEKRDITEKELEKIFENSYNRKSIKVTLKFTNRIGEQLTEYFVKDTIKRQEDGSYEVEGWYPYEEGLFKFVLGFGKDCRITSPEHLMEETKDYLEEILAEYQK